MFVWVKGGQWGVVIRAQKCLKAQPPPLSWLSPALIMPEGEIATELSGPPLPELAARLSSLFAAKDRDMGASTQAG